jgi:hypothetical protein
MGKRIVGFRRLGICGRTEAMAAQILLVLLTEGALPAKKLVQLRTDRIVLEGAIEHRRPRLDHASAIHVEKIQQLVAGRLCRRR